MENKIYNLRDVEHEQLKSDREEFSLSAVLTQFFGFEKIFVHHEILEPGKRSSSTHAHTKREEMIVVLEGHPLVQLENKKLQLKSGDFIGFKPNETHCIENTGFENASLLVICSSNADDEVIYVEQ